MTFCHDVEPMPFHILALCGSQRARSMSAGLLRACHDLAPAGVAIELFAQNKDFPLFNPERTDVPPGVLALQDAITAADALLIARLDRPDVQVDRRPPAGKGLAVTQDRGHLFDVAGDPPDREKRVVVARLPLIHGG